jgi:DNA invertase Pin-like site-specific DNA recombinase
MAALAEHEAKAISDRTKAALGAAKARGKKLGGRRWAIESVASKGNVESAKARTEQARKRADDLAPIIEAIKAAGATSLCQIADGLNRRGIKIARGGQWSAVQVMRISSKHSLYFR